VGYYSADTVICSTAGFSVLIVEQHTDAA